MNAITTGTTSFDLKPRRLWPAKLRATGIHLGISAAILIAFLYLILVKWYPDPFFTTDGGWTGLQIMLFVDMVLGPALTFIIFNPRKRTKEIFIDLSIVALVQISALVWGGLTVYQQRPIAVVEWNGTLRSLTQGPLHQQGKEISDLQQFGSGLVPVIHAKPPTDAQAHMKMTEMALNEELGETQQFWLYRSFKGSFAEMKKDQALDIASISKTNVEIGGKVEKLLSQRGGKKVTDFVFLKFIGRYKDAIFVFDLVGNQVGTITWSAPARL